MMAAQRDYDDDWSDEEESLDDRLNVAPYLMGQHYEEPTPGGGRRVEHPPQSNRTNRRPRSDSNQNLPKAPPAPSGRSNNGPTRRQTLASKPTLPPRINWNSAISESSSLQSKISMFENVIQRPTHIPDSPMLPRTPTSHDRNTSIPKRPPRTPATLPRPQPGGNRRSPLPTGHSSGSDSTLVERNGHSRRHQKSNLHNEDLAQSLKTELDQRSTNQHHASSSGSRFKEAAMKSTSADRSGSHTARHPSQAHPGRSQDSPSSRTRVTFPDDQEQRPPEPPPPRLQPKNRPTSIVHPLTSNYKPNSAPRPSHLNRSQTLSATPIETPLHERPWYHGKIDRPEAERRLYEKRENGTFLIREGKVKHFPFVLSLIYNGHVYHTLVRKKLNGSVAAGKSEKPNEPEFESIEKLVAHYRDHQISVMGKHPDRGIECSTALVTVADKPPFKR